MSDLDLIAAPAGTANPAVDDDGTGFFGAAEATARVRGAALEVAPFFPAIEESVERGEIVGRRYTAERLYKCHPEKFRAVVHWLAQGVGMLRIARLVGVHHLSVKAVRDLFAADVEAEKARLARLCRDGAELCLERIVESVETLPAQTLGLTAAQLIDKFQLLTGGATARVEEARKPGVPTHEEFARILDGLPRAQGRVVEGDAAAGPGAGGSFLAAVFSARGAGGEGVDGDAGGGEARGAAVDMAGGGSAGAGAREGAAGMGLTPAAWGANAGAVGGDGGEDGGADGDGGGGVLGGATDI